ncbi:MAG TPA: glycosyltransferase family 39 protein [Polyangiaceae bacterium]
MFGDLMIGAVAFAARAAALLWASGRFPAAADGIYYHALAVRIAHGLGSTWLWPDGKITYAAHYPIGYPALLALAYKLGGDSAAVGGWMNAVLGTIAAIAAYRLALQLTTPRWAFAAGLGVAFHPGLVMYTPALMTEGVAAALLVIGAWAASRRSRGGLVASGVVMGVATLIRPQSLLLAPCWGSVCAEGGAPLQQRLRRAGVATALALAVCAPWTARNCVRMHQCALVSFNGGWNLLIGASDEASGSWSPVAVPEACRSVWDEAEKDACFGREARRNIAQNPARWLGLIPARLAATFDYAGAPGFYLHESNPGAFGDRAKLVLGIIETAYERLFYLAALITAAMIQGPRRKARGYVAAVSTVLLFQVHAYLAVLGLALSLALLGKRLLDGPVLPAATFFAVAATAAVHAVFFGSGRYSMLTFPLITALGFGFGSLFTGLTAGTSERDTRNPDEETTRCP